MHSGFESDPFTATIAFSAVAVLLIGYLLHRRLGGTSPSQGTLVAVLLVVGGLAGAGWALWRGESVLVSAGAGVAAMIVWVIFDLDRFLLFNYEQSGPTGNNDSERTQEDRPQRSLKLPRRRHRSSFLQQKSY